MEKLKKCNICGYKFKINKKEKYTVITKSSLLQAEEKYDAIDCPNCGCQIMLWPRYMKVNDEEKTEV